MRTLTNTLLASAALPAALLMATPSYADPAGNWYVGATGDVTWMNHSDTGGGGNVDLGYRFWPSNYGDFRAEAEIGYHDAKGDNGYGSTHYFSYMGNLYYDFNNWNLWNSGGWKVVPYIGGGLGDATVDYGANSSFDRNARHEFGNLGSGNNAFAYQGMAGLNFVVASMPSVDWSVGYRYFGADTNSSSYSGSYHGRLSANSAEIGIRYHF